MSGRRLFKRETLLNNLKKMVENIRSERLPATVKAVYVYGGILRGKERMKDLDVTVEYELTPEQELMWEAFTQVICSKETRGFFRQMERQGIALDRLVKLEPSKKLLSNGGLYWLRFLSWTDILHGSGCHPDKTKVIKKQIVGNMKGLHVFWNRPPSKSYIKVWSPESPDIDRNLERGEDSKKRLLEMELDRFLEQLGERKERFLEAAHEAKVLADSLNIPINVSVESPEVQRKGERNVELLERDCEKLRKKLKEYDDYANILFKLSWSMESYKRVGIHSLYGDEHDYTVIEYVTKKTIEGMDKRDVNEVRIREILKQIGLPEDKVCLIKHYGGKEYRVATTEEEIAKLTAYKREMETRANYERVANKPLKNRNLYARVFFDEDKPTVACLNYSMWMDDEGLENNVLVSGLKESGFSVEKNHGYLEAKKEIVFRGKETPKDVEGMVKKAVDNINGLF